MITIHDKSACCGCAACVQICPKKCIEFEEDNQGFRYPCVNTAICINCGLCEVVCPIKSQNHTRSPIKVYASKNKDEQIRSKSSSGGVFTALAEAVLRQGGVVFGARFDSNWEVEHDFVSESQDLSIFRGSKYMQSRIGNTYVQAERFLKDGRYVLYSGTPCQIAGFNRYLRKEYDNLLTVDVICHGVPSPLIWREYLKEVSSGREVTDVDFRFKSTSWKMYDVVVKGKSENLLRQPYYENLYMKGFLSDIYLRRSCYTCPFKSGRSGADLTLGDFWGIQNYMGDFDDDKGVSAVLVQTNKALQLLESLDLENREVQYEYVLKGNPSIEHCAWYNERHIRKFWSSPNRIKAINKILSKISGGGYSQVRRLVRFIKRWI